MKRVLAISGSTKLGSTNESILRAIANAYADTADFRFYEGIGRLPHFNPDLDNSDPPEGVVEFRRLVGEADGVLISTPEYVFSLPGVLKNAIEWTVSTTVFNDKPAAFIIAATSGEKAFDSLAEILKTIGAKIDTDSMLLIRGARGKLGDTNDIVEESMRHDIDRMMKAFLRTIDET